MTDKIVVLSTCDSEEAARTVARSLLEKRVAACVNIVPGATSVYWWQGRIEEAGEWLLIAKSSRRVLPELKAAIAQVHSYQVPEIVVLGIEDGSEAYLKWLDAELTPPHR